MINTTISTYKIIRQIGEGGMGVVYLAQNNAGIYFAIKMLKNEFTEDVKMLKRFQNECVAMKRLKGHPHIIQIQDVINDNGIPMLVMEYLEGSNLDEYVKKNKCVSDFNLLKVWMIQTLEALEYAHNLSPQIIHRDIKPSNIFLTKFNTIKILDFGIVKVLEDATNPNLTEKVMTSTSSRIGSLNYMSPELSFDSNLVDLRSDIYSFGKTLKFLISGGNPYATVSDEPFKTIIGKATQENPNDRYNNCGEILQLLRKTSDDNKNKTATEPSSASPSSNSSKRSSTWRTPKDSKIVSKVKSILIDKLGVDESEVTREASLTNDLGADELDLIEIIMECEHEFGISIPDDQTEKLATVGDIIEFIECNTY